VFVLVVVVGLAVLAVAAAVAVVIAARLARRRRAAGVDASWAWRSAVSEIGMVAGTLPWIVLILMPVGRGRTVHLVPIREIVDLLSGDLFFALAQIGGNLLVFAAFGALAPVRWRIGLPAVAGIAALTSALLECVQYVMDTGRFTSVDDVLLNTTGAVLAALLTRRWWRRRLSAGAVPPAGRDRTPGQRIRR
jgi:hypothetical protein